jgi:hypothetical protein
LSEVGIDTATSELHRAFNQYNAKFWNGSLPRTQLTIQSAAKHKALGWCSAEPIWSACDETAGRYEINIAAEYLNRTPVEIAATLLHEMAHLANAVRGIKDCNANQYHNKHFKREAERVGFTVTRMDNHGYAKTAPSIALTEYLTENALDATAFGYYRQHGNQSAQPKSPIKTWSCGCTKIRTTVELDALCNTCGKPFVTQSKGGN